MKTQTDKHSDLETASVASDSPNQSNETREVIRIIYVNVLGRITADADGKIVAQFSNMEDANRYLKSHVHVAIDSTPEIKREWLDALTEKIWNRSVTSD